jgi:hypothetical protein
MFNNSKKILATITWMFSLLPREAFQDPHPTVPICVIYGDHKMLQLSIYLTAICIRNMQSRHASVSSCFWHKTELLPCQKDVFFFCWTPYVLPMISQSLTNAEHADQVCVSIHWPSWIQVKCRAWLHTHGAPFRVKKIDVPACTNATSDLALRWVLVLCQMSLAIYEFI